MTSKLLKYLTSGSKKGWWCGRRGGIWRGRRARCSCSRYFHCSFIIIITQFGGGGGCCQDTTCHDFGGIYIYIPLLFYLSLCTQKWFCGVPLFLFLLCGVFLVFFFLVRFFPFSLLLCLPCFLLGSRWRNQTKPNPTQPNPTQPNQPHKSWDR